MARNSTAGGTAAVRALPTEDAPTKVRYRILGLTFVLAFIMYLDRVCMGLAQPSIMREFNLDKITMGWSVSAFLWAYAMFQIPGGWMADRFGRRGVGIQAKHDTDQGLAVEIGVTPPGLLGA